MDNNSIISWLLEGDVSIQYQVKRDLQDSSKKELKKLQDKIPAEGWCKKFLSRQNLKTGLWGNGVYSPKWISTHYTLLDLKNLGIPGINKQYITGSEIILNRLWNNQQGVAKKREQDICICGMLLSICSYAGMKQPKLDGIIDYIISRHQPDGGWNCNWWKGSKKSSLHTTLTILEGIRDLKENKYSYRIDELMRLKDEAHEWLLKRNLYKSLSGGETISPRFLSIPYPCRWKYDILRCLDYFQSINMPYDKRMKDAIDIIIKKRKKNGRWGLSSRYPGKVHFDMEKGGGDSRWNTLRALRVLNKYGSKS